MGIKHILMTRFNLYIIYTQIKARIILLIIRYDPVYRKTLFKVLETLHSCLDQTRSTANNFQHFSPLFKGFNADGSPIMAV